MLRRLLGALRTFWEGEPAPPLEQPAEPPAALLRRLQVSTLRPLAMLLGGEERSRQRGPGMELSEVRQYQPGDDVRHIDWGITARTSEPVVREAHAERALDAWLLLDCSASLNWGTARFSKRDQAAAFVAVAAQLLGQRGHRVGALLFAARPFGIVPPSRGRAQLLRLLTAVQAAPAPIGEGATDLALALRGAEPLLRRRGLVLVVSDWLVAPGWQPALARLARRHDVVAVRLSDPREADLPDIGLATFEDPETGAQLLVNTADARLRARFAEAAGEQAAALRADCARAGVTLLELTTADDMLPALVRMLAARKRQRGGPGAPKSNLKGAAA
jgi:uncharacterized protein (DUF58 family)